MKVLIRAICGAGMVVIFSGTLWIGILVFREFYPNEPEFWTLLDRGVSGMPGGTEEGLSAENWRTVQVANPLQTGYLRFADGETWRYGFLSYHSVPGTNSFSLFQGTGETWRLRGTAFCCEVFPHVEQPKNAEEFRALLKKTGDVAENRP